MCIFALLLCLATLLTTFVGCSEEEEEFKGEYITAYLTDNVYDLDPAKAYKNEALSKIVGMMFDTLFTLDENGKVKNELASDWKVDEEKNIKDEEFLYFISDQNKKYGFINIYCGDSATLSSCCRLRSDRKNEYFNSFGSGSSKIGSLGVCTINLPRLAIKYKGDEFFKELKSIVEICAKVNNAKRKIVEKRIKNHVRQWGDRVFSFSAKP